MLLILINLITILHPMPLKDCYIPGELVVLGSDAQVILINGNPAPPFRTHKNGAVFVIPVGLFSKDILVSNPSNNELILLKKCKFEFPAERLTLPNEMVFLSPENLARYEREKAEMDSIWIKVTNERYFEGKFTLPATGSVVKNFGFRRIINGEERTPHTGIDIKAPLGTPVVASESGKVVYVKETFFGGNSIIIDHGLGIYTMYFHLNEIKVKNGQMVRKGEVIGTVGMTGRATAPHLHWGVRVLGEHVNPLSLIDIDFSKYDNYSPFK